MNTTQTRHSPARAGGRSGSRSGTRNSFSSSPTRRPKSHSYKKPVNKHQGHNSFSNRGNGRSRGGRKMPQFNPSLFINKNPAEAVSEVYTPKNTFETFGLSSQLLQTLQSIGITTPTPIQDQIIHEVLAGHDTIGLAETGTGKTAAFLLPLIERTLKDRRRQTLILAPTRELAVQIQEELKMLARGLALSSTVCVGGMNINPQIRSLKRPNHFIIGTPGRVLDLMKRSHLKTTAITSVVLDEADRMLDMGFIADMRAILSGIPKNRQTLFFSATMTKAAESLTHDFLSNPLTVSVKKRDVTSSIKQDVVRHTHADKFDTLLAVLAQNECTRVLIFGSMKHSVEKLSQELSKSGISAESIHGNKNHGQRTRALERFKQGKTRVLVATDVAARGIHVDEVSHVINYDLPSTFEDYVHRIGRTGRRDKHGTALTFISS